MSVIGFDNIPPSNYTIPPLTTIDYDGYNLGVQAARLTIDRLLSPDRPPEHLELPPHLVVRRSTGPARPTS